MTGASSHVRQTLNAEYIGDAVHSTDKACKVSIWPVYIMRFFDAQQFALLTRRRTMH